MDFGFLLTVLIPFILGVVATFVGFLLQEFIKTRGERKAIARAILAEFRVFRERLEDFAPSRIAPDADQPFPWYRMHFRADPVLPISEGLLGKLGIFPRSDAEVIARVYAQTISYVNNARHFTRLIERLDHLDPQIRSLRLLRLQAPSSIIPAPAISATNIMEPYDRRSVKVDQTAELTRLEAEYKDTYDEAKAWWKNVKKSYEKVFGDLFDELCASLDRYA